MATVQEANAVLEVRLAYRPPFGWPDMLAYFAVRGIPGVEHVERAPGAASNARSVRLGGLHGWLRVTHQAARNALLLEAALTLAPVVMQLAERIRTQFDLDADPQRIHVQLARDPLLATTLAQLPGRRPRLAKSGCRQRAVGATPDGKTIAATLTRLVAMARLCGTAALAFTGIGKG